MRLLTLSKPSGQADGGSYSRYWAQHLSQHVVNTCFPVSTLAVLTPIFVSQQLPLKADLCTNVHPQALVRTNKEGHDLSDPRKRGVEVLIGQHARSSSKNGILGKTAV